MGIDFRPATGALYGLGDAGGVYTVDMSTAQATFKAQLNVALSGTEFGVDFNPTVDRLRIVGDDGQNLRANVDDGSTLVGFFKINLLAGEATLRNWFPFSDQVVDIAIPLAQ